MDYFYFCLTLLHVLAGFLFVGIPVVAAIDLWRRPAESWPFWRPALQQSAATGVAAMALGVLMAGFRWDDSFERAWEVVGSRWIFAFFELGFSLAILTALAAYVPTWPTFRWKRGLAWFCLVLAATNSLYHFPALMVVSREIRTRPEWLLGLEEPVVRQLLFSGEILYRWLHVALASLFFSLVWLRFLVGIQAEAQSQGDQVPEAETKSEQNTSKPTTTQAPAPAATAEETITPLALATVDRSLQLGVIWGLGLMLTSGLVLLLHLPPASLHTLLALGSGRSNNLMIGVVAATVAGIHAMLGDPRPTGLRRFLDVGLVIVAATAMLSDR
jgi:hypothetical protein